MPRLDSIEGFKESAPKFKNCECPKGKCLCDIGEMCGHNNCLGDFSSLSVGIDEEKLIEVLAMADDWNRRGDNSMAFYISANANKFLKITK